MADKIPISDARELATKHGCRQIVVLAYNGEETLITTWGKTKADCEQAAKAQTHWDGTRIMPESDEQNRNVHHSERSTNKGPADE